MILYLLEWDNGLDFDDRDVMLVGVFTSADRRRRAASSLEADPSAPPYRREGGHFVETEVEADRILS